MQVLLTPIQSLNTIFTTVHKKVHCFLVNDKGENTMKYVFKNLKNFAKQEKVIFIVLIVCIITSSFVMNFSYGLYINYKTSLYESIEELKDIYLDITENETLTKGEFRQFIEAIDEETHDKINLIYAESDLTKHGYNDESYAFFPMRFDINKGKYCTSDYIKDLWESKKLLKRGEFLSNVDEETGAYSAMVSEDEHGDKSIGDTVDFLGHTYKIVGIYRAGSFTPLVPFLTVPDEIEIVRCCFTFPEFITRQSYEDLIRAANETIPNKLIFPELQLPDDDVFSLYRNIILISVMVALVSVMNFAMLYLFVIRKRRNALAVMRLCGARKLQVVKLYLSECIVITIPMFFLGTLTFHILLNMVFAKIFPYMKESYSLTVYVLIFIIYLLAMMLVLGIIIRKNTCANVKEYLLEGNI